MNSLFDFSYLRSLSSDPGFITQMILVFLNVVPTQVDSLNKSIETDDALKAGLVLHQLKPSMQTFGCNNLVTEIIELEYLAKAGHSPSVHNQRYLQLIKDIEGVIIALKQLQEQELGAS